MHSEVLVIDPLSNDPVVITGSHNFSAPASERNDENLVVVRGRKAPAAAYAVRMMSVYAHYRYRSYIREMLTQDKTPWSYLDDDAWLRRSWSRRRWRSATGPEAGRRAATCGENDVDDAPAARRRHRSGAARRPAVPGQGGAGAVMRLAFGAAALVVALAVVASLARTQFGRAPHAVAAPPVVPMPASEAAPSAAHAPTPPQQARQLQRQVADDVARALDQGARRSVGATEDEIER